MIRLALIAAVARNGVIGRDNGLPWHIPEDLRHFREVTLGKPLVMGRRTWDSIGRPLPGRPSLVVSRDAGFMPEGAEVFLDLEAALRRARALAGESGAEEAMVIGGAQIYAAVLDEVERLYLTEVHADIAGDTHFPEVDWSAWRETVRREFPATVQAPGWAFVQYDRR